jgi:hypothetical protein
MIVPGAFARIVKLVVVSDKHDPVELASRLGVAPDESTRIGEVGGASQLGRPAKENSWELHECGANSADLSELLDNLFGRSRTLEMPLKQLKAEGCTVILRIVMRLSPNDPHGAGYAIDGSMISWLAGVGVDFIDVDQYLYEG